MSRALARGSAPTPTRRKRKSLLDPHRTHVDQLVAEGVWNAELSPRTFWSFAGEFSSFRRQGTRGERR